MGFLLTLSYSEVRGHERANKSRMDLKFRMTSAVKFSETQICNTSIELEKTPSIITDLHSTSWNIKPYQIKAKSSISYLGKPKEGSSIKDMHELFSESINNYSINIYRVSSVH